MPSKSSLKKFLCPLEHYSQLFLPLVVVGWSWISDLPMELSDPLHKKYHMSDTKIQQLYSFHALPNIIALLFCGFLLKKMGPKFMYFCLIVTCIGHALFSIGIEIQNYASMLCGRILIGMSQKSGLVAQIYITKVYTRDSDIILLNSLCFIIAKFVASMGMYANPELYIQTNSFNYTLIASSAFLGVSFIGFTVYYELIKKVKPHVWRLVQ
jgi:MFS family permease